MMLRYTRDENAAPGSWRERRVASPPRRSLIAANAARGQQQQARYHALFMSYGAAARCRHVHIRATPAFKMPRCLSSAYAKRKTPHARSLRV